MLHLCASLFKLILLLVTHSFYMFQNVDELVEKAMPHNIRLNRELNLDAPHGKCCEITFSISRRDSTMHR